MVRGKDGEKSLQNIGMYCEKYDKTTGIKQFYYSIYKVYIQPLLNLCFFQPHQVIFIGKLQKVFVSID